MSSHVDQLFAAVSVLAGHGEIKQRLIVAYEQHLANIDESELPIPVKQPYADLRHLMSAVAPLIGDCRIRASVRKMSVAEADKCAHLIVEIYGLMIRHSDSVQAPLPFKLNPEDAPALPPFLVKSG